MTLLRCTWRIVRGAGEPAEFLRIEATLGRGRVERATATDGRCGDASSPRTLGLDAHALGRAVVTHDPAAALTHIDIPGWLLASIDDATGRPLYARTDLLRALGVRPGRHELVPDTAIVAQNEGFFASAGAGAGAGAPCPAAGCAPG